MLKEGIGVENTAVLAVAIINAEAKKAYSGQRPEPSVRSRVPAAHIFLLFRVSGSSEWGFWQTGRKAGHVAGSA